MNTFDRKRPIALLPRVKLNPDTVHRHAVEWRKVPVSDEILLQDHPEGILQGNLDGRKLLYIKGNDFVSFFDSDHDINS